MNTLLGGPIGVIDGANAPPAGIRMYAIAFDLDIESFGRLYPGKSPNNGFKDVRDILVDQGFLWQQGSVYFGEPERIDAVACVLAAQRLTRELPWFAESVRDIRMLRIEENNDLLPAIASA